MDNKRKKQIVSEFLITLQFMCDQAIDEGNGGDDPVGLITTAINYMTESMELARRKKNDDQSKN